MASIVSATDEFWWFRASWREGAPWEPCIVQTDGAVWFLGNDIGYSRQSLVKQGGEFGAQFFLPKLP